ncbi:MAG: ribonuclease J [Desulfonatronovibrionaceae bacterium]
MAEAIKEVRITPLGGLGEIGMNCTVMETEDSMVVIDCGLMFPDDFHLGVDVVIPRLDYIFERKDKLQGVVLTHGHEDHIGALPWLLPELNVPVYSSEFTLGLVRNKLTEYNLAEHVSLRPVSPDKRLNLKDFSFAFFPACHSIIQGYGLGIDTPAGRIVHSGDFKIDRNPLGGHSTDMQAISDFSSSGVTLLMSDSTNVEREGYALTEKEIKDSLKSIFDQAEGRILITLFSSHIQRMQEIFDLALNSGRKVAVSGRSLIRNIEVARRLGFVEYSEENFVHLENLQKYKDSQIVLLLTGSQGEPLSALTRVALGEHRQIKIHPGDTVIMSSRFIPGNTKAITKVINNLYRLGAEVFYEKVRAIHASGHAHREELKLMLHTVRPKFFLPVHGEYRHLLKHSRLAVECGVAPERSLVLEDGQSFTLSESGVRFEEAVNTESVLVDGKGVGDVGQAVLRERQNLGEEGLVIVSLVIDKDSGELILGPELASKGFIFEQRYAHVLEEARGIVLDVFNNIPHDEPVKMEDRIRSALRRFFRKILERDPMVFPLVAVV